MNRGTEKCTPKIIKKNCIHPHTFSSWNLKLFIIGFKAYFWWDVERSITWNKMRIGVAEIVSMMWKIKFDPPCWVTKKKMERNEKGIHMFLDLYLSNLSFSENIHVKESTSFTYSTLAVVKNSEHLNID